MILSINNIKTINESMLPKEYRSDFKDVKEAVKVGLYNADKEVQSVIDMFINTINLSFIKTVKTTDTSVLKLPLSSINIDKARFQNRSKLNDTVLQNIVDNYNPIILDPVIVWKDKNGKTYLLAGHHRLEATRIKKYKTIPAKYFIGTEKEAINFARVESNSNRSLETPIERAKIYREMRAEKSKKDVFEKAKKTEGKNANYIINLSYLNPKGVVLADLETLENADKQNIAIIEKVADWIGQAFRNYDGLLAGSHEKEMHDFLLSSDSKRIKTKVEFLQKINSVVSAFDYDKNKPLNLKRYKYETQGEKIYNEEFNEIKTKIDDLIEQKSELKNRFNDPNSSNFISPNNPNYEAALKQLDKKVNEINNDIKFYQNKMIELQNKKSSYINSGSNQSSLFGAHKTIILPNPTKRNKVVGLKYVEQIAPKTREIRVETNENNKPTSNLPFKPVAETLRENKAPAKLFKIVNPDLKRFLGNVEIKPKQSLAITLDSGEGGGKTHTAFQFAGEMANNGYKVIVWSLEEHAESNLSKDKQKKYFSDYAKQNISVVSEETTLSKEENYQRIIDSIKFYDIIVIDSWAKVLEMNSTASFDGDFRKAFDGKLFFIIFQRTVDGKMRGGSKGGFDGDIILKVEVFREDFRKNYIYNHKNRYNDYMPISELKYSPFHQRLLPKEMPQNNNIVLTTPNFRPWKN